MDPTKVEKQSTVGTAVILLLLLAAIIGISVALVMNPDVLENIAFVIAMVVVGIAAIAVIIAIFAGLLAIPMYIKKGPETQTDMSYSLDDVKEVEGSMENRKE